MTSPDGLLVREATEADWDAVRALTVEVYGGDQLVSAPYLARMADTGARGADPYAAVLVATDEDGDLLGSVTFTTPGSSLAEGGPGEAGFRMLAVRRTARGRGAGERLVTACVELARAHRLGRVAIVTKDNMPAAMRLYDRLGFRRLPWRDGKTPSGQPLRAYALDLAPVVVREATEDEVAAAGEVVLASYLADGMVTADDGYAGSLRDAHDRWRNATLLVAVDPGGTVVGTVTFCRPGSPYAEISGPGEAEFRMLGVDPAARGAGIGEALVHACLDLAGAAGDETLVLSTLDGLTTAPRLYARLGFERVPARDWRPGRDVLLRVRARPVLPPARPRPATALGTPTR